MPVQARAAPHDDTTKEQSSRQRRNLYIGRNRKGLPDTFGFNGVDTSQCTGDTVALTYPSGISD
jgi:hypothetical protein